MCPYRQILCRDCSYVNYSGCTGYVLASIKGPGKLFPVKIYNNSTTNIKAN